MKKTYWWRVLVLSLGIGVFCYSWVASFGAEFGLCKKINGVEKCLVGYNSYVDSLGFLSISLVVISVALFFVSNIVFRKWLKFAIVFFIATFIFIIIAPEYSGGWMNFGPTKESVSIWMGVLFVIISLVLIIWQSINERKSSK